MSKSDLAEIPVLPTLRHGREEFELEPGLITRDVFLSNKGCPRYHGTPGLPVPCAGCPTNRCWFIEMTAMRRAGLPALTFQAWRAHLVSKDTDFGPNDDGDDDDGYEFEID